jgi:hypothetical protein
MSSKRIPRVQTLVVRVDVASESIRATCGAPRESNSALPPPLAVTGVASVCW